MLGSPNFSRGGWGAGIRSQAACRRGRGAGGFYRAGGGGVRWDGVDTNLNRVFDSYPRAKVVLCLECKSGSGFNVCSLRSILTRN